MPKNLEKLFYPMSLATTVQIFAVKLQRFNFRYLHRVKSFKVKSILHTLRAGKEIKPQ